MTISLDYNKRDIVV